MDYFTDQRTGQRIFYRGGRIPAALATAYGITPPSNGRGQRLPGLIVRRCGEPTGGPSPHVLREARAALDAALRGRVRRIQLDMYGEAG